MEQGRREAGEEEEESREACVLGMVYVRCVLEWCGSGVVFSPGTP